MQTGYRPLGFSKTYFKVYVGALRAFVWHKHTFCETRGLLHNLYVTNVVKSHRTWDWALFHTLNTRSSATLLDHTPAWTRFVSCCWNIEDLYNSHKRIGMWLQSRCFAMFIPCHWEQNKVQATVWCRSSLLSKCPPVPRSTPAPVWSTTPLAHMIHLQPSRKKHLYGSACLRELPALDPQWRVHPGWGKSRTQATHIQYSQTAWALLGRSAAEMGPSETKAPNSSEYEEAVASKKKNQII